jgi:dTDP-4-amino-4,6-dideoxygalactose transaminase
MHIPFNKAFSSNETLDTFLKEIPKLIQLQGDGSVGKRISKLLECDLGGNVVLTDSCTSALELGIYSMNYPPNSEIIMPAFTFSSCANAAILNGHTPVFVDIEPLTLNIDPRKILEAISNKTRAVMVIHYAGISAQIDEISELCSEHNLDLIEDNAHGFGGSYKKKSLGTFGEFSTLSFHGTKNISTGEGGALCLKDPSKLERAEIFREKGTDRGRYLRGEIDKYTWMSVGSSMLLSELQALLLGIQLPELGNITNRRREIGKIYGTQLFDWAASQNVQLMNEPDYSEHSGHIFWMKFPTENAMLRARDFLISNDIQSSSHYQPLHNSAGGRRHGKSAGNLIVTEETSQRLLRLPIYPSLGESEISYILDTLSNLGI